MHKLITLLFLVLAQGAFSQGFVKVTDSTNPIVSFTVPPNFNYLGAAWVDYDNDGDVDLFAAPDNLFENLGGGQFQPKNSGIGAGISAGGWTFSGTSWADADNDGDLDCLLAYATSKLYLNDGAGNFTALTGAPFDVQNRAWAGAFGDFNNDTYPDITLTFPTAAAASFKSQILKTTGPLVYEKITGLEYTDVNAPHTTATWADFDDDGDFDLFAASGPALTPPAAPDFIYRNLLVENGSADLERITDLPFASDLQDGQSYSFIDFDNDRDLDICLANYSFAPNRLYRNDGNGSWTSVSTAFTAANFKNCLSNAWGDFDNDGDLDVIFTRDSQQKALLFFNDGEGNFIQDTSSPLAQNSISTGASIGDYDNDGDLDVFLNARTDLAGKGKALFRNDSLGGSNHWINFKLTGTASNKSALGAKIFVKVTINGQSTWLRRDVSAQNTFQGQNDLRVHFGLGDATTIDSLVVRFPSGAVTTCSGVGVNQFYSIEEKDGVWDLCVTPVREITQPGTLKIMPNPVKDEFYLEFSEAPGAGELTLTLLDVSGKVVLEQSFSNRINASFLPAGVFSVVVKSSSGKTWSGKLVKY